MPKTSIYTALYLSLLSSTVMASDDRDEPKTPTKVKTQLAELEAQGRFKGMTPKSKTNKVNFTKKSLTRQFNLEQEERGVEEAKEKSGKAFDKLEEETRKLQDLQRALQEQLDDKLLEIQTSKETLEREKSEINEKLEGAQAELVTAQNELSATQQRLTTLDTITEENKAEITALKLKVETQSTFIGELQESHDDIEERLLTKAKAQKETEKAYKDKLDALVAQLSGVTISSQSSSSSAPKYDSKFEDESNF